MKKYLLICLVSMTVGITRAEVPKLFCERQFNNVTLVDAVNHFVAIGQDAAFKELEAIGCNAATNTNWIFSRGFNTDERIGWVCRILFEPKGNSPLRPPKYGTLSLPEKSMILEKWPLYPVVFYGSNYFVLAEKYSTDKVPENFRHYLAYCRANGVFRTTPIASSTKEQAIKDAADLRQSALWRSVKWNDDQGPSFLMGEQWTWGYIQRQAKSMPEPVVARQKPKAGSSAATVAKPVPAIVSSE